MQYTIDRNIIIRDINHQAWRISKERIIKEHDTQDPVAHICYDDILYDVDYTSWKVANVRIAEPENRHEAQTDGSNERWFRRQYKSAISQVRDILRPFLYMDDPVEDCVDNDLRFRFPDTWCGSISVIEGYINQFITDYILAQWFAMTIPDEAATHLALAEQHKQAILDEAHSEDLNDEWLTLQLNTATQHVAAILRWCCNLNDNTFAFSFPEEWRGSFSSLTTYIYRYVVDYIMHEWYKPSTPDTSATFLASATNWEDKIINEARSEDVRNVFFRL